MTPPSFALGVLAGGRSTRMGTDKAAVPLRGSSLLEHAIRRYAVAGSPALVSTRLGQTAPAGTIAVQDGDEGQGPLAGIVALLAACPAERLLVVPVDLPALPSECGAVLARHLGDLDAALCSLGGRLEPFPAMLHARIASTVRRLYDDGARRADAYVAHVRSRVVPFEELFPALDASTAFLNVNRPEDLARAEALFSSRRA